jgi:UDP-glucose 4-epimerase
VQILVTGGAGFIGSHLCERLVQRGHNVSVIDDLSTGRLSNLDSVINEQDFKFTKGSILNMELLASLIADSDYVFHLAAAVGVFNIVNNPLDSLLTNIRGTENVLEAANKFEIPVLLTSSSEVYGKNISNSLKESDDRILGSPVTLRWSYSEAKAIDESLAFAYFQEKKLQTRIIRFFNTVGPRQLGNYGMVVPRFIHSALKNEPISVYGNGKQTRCFAHVSDAIDALEEVAFAGNTVGKVINIGNENEISILDLAKKIILDTKSKSQIIFVPYEKAYGDGFEDMERRVPNLDLINSLVGWKPKRNLTTIIEDISTEMRATLRAE